MNMCDLCNGFGFIRMKTDKHTITRVRCSHCKGLGKSRQSHLDTVLRDAHARGLEEAAGMAERERDEAQKALFPGDEYWVGRMNAAASLLLRIRARAEAVRKGEV